MKMSTLSLVLGGFALSNPTWADMQSSQRELTLETKNEVARIQLTDQHRIELLDTAQSMLAQPRPQMLSSLDEFVLKTELEMPLMPDSVDQLTDLATLSAVSITTDAATLNAPKIPNTATNRHMLQDTTVQLQPDQPQAATEVQIAQNEIKIDEPSAAQQVAALTAIEPAATTATARLADVDEQTKAEQVLKPTTEQPQALATLTGVTAEGALSSSPVESISKAAISYSTATHAVDTQHHDAVVVSDTISDQKIVELTRILAQGQQPAQVVPLTPAEKQQELELKIRNQQQASQAILLNHDRVNSKVASRDVSFASVVGNSAASWMEKFPLPKNNSRISSSFGPRVMGGRAENHQGIDFAAPTGTPIFATGDGVVTRAGWGRGYGQYVEINHGNGYSTRYGHASRLHVQVGDRVEAGDHIANVGCTGRCTGPHLHYEVVKNGERRNPASYLALLP